MDVMLTFRRMALALALALVAPVLAHAQSVLFQDGLSGPAGADIGTSGYTPTLIGGGAGAGRWSPTNGVTGATNLVLTADGWLRDNYPFGTGIATCTAAPPSDAYDVEADFAVKSAAGNTGSIAYLVDRYAPGSLWGGNGANPANGYQWGLASDGATGINATFAVAIGSAYTTIVSRPVPGAAAGLVYHLRKSETVAGGAVVTNCYLSRSSDGFSLDATGAFVAGATPAVTFSDPAPPPRASVGIRLNSPGTNDAADIQVRNFKVTDLSPPATGYNLSGPSTGTLGTPSAPFTIQPNGPIAQTLTLTDGGAGGVFAPPTLTWAGDATPKAFTYAAGSATASLGCTGGSLPVTPPTLPYTAAVNVALDRCWIDPSGNLLLVSPRLVAGGAPLKITGVVPGGSVTPSAGGETNGTAVAIPDIQPFWDDENTTATFVLRKPPNEQATDDLAAGAVFAGAGWLLRDVRPGTANYFLADGSTTRWIAGKNVVVGDTFRETPAPADTATFTLGGLTPGRQMIADLSWSLYGPDRTTQATYTVRDGFDNSIVGTFTRDQTRAPPFDSAWAGYRWSNLGRVTVKGTSLTITVANTAATGNLAVDCFRCSYDPLPVVPPGGSATVNLPAGTIRTASGTLPTLTAQPALLTTDAQWSPSATSGYRMKLGYNVESGASYKMSQFLADRARSGGPWVCGANFPYPHVDPATGELTAAVQEGGSYPFRQIVGNPSNGDDNWGIPVFRENATWRLEFTYNGTGTPVVYLDDPGNHYQLIGPPIGGGAINLGGNRWRVSQTFNTRPFTPLSTTTYPYNPAYSGSVFVTSQSVISNLSVYDGSNPGASSTDGTVPLSWPFQTHPVPIRQLKGTGIASVRFLDASNGFASNAVEFADLPSPKIISVDIPTPKLTLGIVSIAPVDLTPADADGAQSWYGVQGASGVVKLVTSAPHDFVTGQTVDLKYPGVDGFPSNQAGKLYLTCRLPDGSAPNLVTSYRIVVVNPTTILLQCYYWDGAGNTSVYPGPQTATLTASPGLINLTGGTITAGGGGVGVKGIPFAACPTFSKETGTSGWYNVNELMSDAGMDAMFDAILAGTTPGVPQRIEPSNEHWNYYQPQFYWFYMLSRRMQVLHSRDPVANPRNPTNGAQAYAEFAGRVFARGRAKFAAAGRGADFIAVMGGFAADPSDAAAIADYCHTWGINFDELTVGGYLGFGPPYGHWAADGTRPLASMARLGPSERVSVLSTLAQGGNWAKVYNYTRAALADPKYAGQFASVKINTYEDGFDDLGDPGDGRGGDVNQVHATVRHGRMYAARKAWLATRDAAGYSLTQRYTLNYGTALQGVTSWVDAPAWDTKAGTGDGSDGQYNNANPWDLGRVVSPELKAMQDFAGSATPAGTPVTGTGRFAVPFALVPGTYQAGFTVAQGSATSREGVRLFANGVSIGSVTSPGTTPIAYLSNTFIALGGDYVMTFLGLTTGTGNVAYIDGIHVIKK